MTLTGPAVPRPLEAVCKSHRLKGTACLGTGQLGGHTPASGRDRPVAVVFNHASFSWHHRSYTIKSPYGWHLACILSGCWRFPMNRIFQKLTKSAIPALVLSAALLVGPATAFAQRSGGGGRTGGSSGGGRSFSGGGGRSYSAPSGRSFSGGGRSYSAPSYSGRAYSGPSYSGRAFNGGSRSYVAPRGFSGGNRGYYSGRFYAGRGYYYGGRFWARPYFGIGIGIPFGWGYSSNYGCGYYDGWGYWQPAPCYVPPDAYYGY